MFNYQFSQSNKVGVFEKLSNKDIVGSDRFQFIKCILHMYDNNLSQINLNSNNIDSNNQFLELNSNLIKSCAINQLEIQEYINENNNHFNEIVNKSLKNIY